METPNRNTRGAQKKRDQEREAAAPSGGGIAGGIRDFSRGAFNTARGVSNALGSVTVGPVLDAGRASFALVTGNNPATLPGGPAKFTEQFNRGAKEAQDEVIGGVGTAINQFGQRATGAKPFTAAPAPAAVPPKVESATAQPAAQPPAAAPSVQAQAGAPLPQQTVPGVFRNGSQFADQAIDGGVAFAPQRGGVTQARPDPLQPSLTERFNRMAQQGASARNQTAARSRESNEASLNGALATKERNQREQTIGLLTQAARGNLPGLSARGRREALTALAQITGQPSGVGSIAGGPRVADEAAIGAANQTASNQNALADEELIAARFGNRQAAAQQAVFDNLQNLATLPPDQQRATLTAVQALQGRSGAGATPYRLQTLQGGINEPDRAIRFNQQTGEFDFIDGAAVGQQVPPKGTFEEYLKATKRDPAFAGMSQEELRRAYDSLPG